MSPGPAPEGQVVLRCLLARDRHLRGCDTASEFPLHKGFAEAARMLTKTFVADEDWAKNAVHGATEVNIAFHFPRPDGDAAARYLSQVDWTQQLDPTKAQAVYPDSAVKAGVKNGEAVMDCTVSDTGSLSACQLVRETPEGVGFGQTAVKIASLMAVNLWTRNGTATPGAHIKLPLQLVYAGDPAPAGPASPSPAQNNTAGRPALESTM